MLPKRQINLMLESQLLTCKVHHTSFIYLASFVISEIQIVIANIFVCNADSVTSAVLEKLVFQNNKTVAMLVFQTNPLVYCYVNNFF